jgi:hypothetical protein
VGVLVCVLLLPAVSLAQQPLELRPSRSPKSDRTGNADRAPNATTQPSSPSGRGGGDDDSGLPRIEIPTTPEGAIGRPRGGSILTRQQFDEIISVMREYDPALADRLSAYAEKNPDRIGPVLAPHLPRLMQLVYLKRHNPDMFRLRVQDYTLNRASLDAAQSLRDAARSKDEDRAAQLRTELRERVTEHFRLRQRMRELELDQLQQRIEELRGQIRQRKDRQAQLIDERVDELTGKAPRGEW